MAWHTTNAVAAAACGIAPQTRSPERKRVSERDQHDARSCIVSAHIREAQRHLADVAVAYQRGNFDTSEDALLDAKQRLRLVQDMLDDAIKRECDERPELVACPECGRFASRCECGPLEDDVPFGPYLGGR